MLIAILWAVMSAAPGDHWPGFRGDGTSLTAATRLPAEWSDATNVGWSVAIPGYGQSSPVVWGDRIFVSSTDGDEKDRLLVSCFAIGTGEKLWSREFPGTLKVKVSDYVSRGAPTPVVDAERVYAFFESGDLIALSQNGELVWQRSLVKDYGEFQGNHGVGASIAATADSLIALVDHSGPSYLLAVNKATGENRWKVDRETKVSWSSPLVRERKGQTEIVVSSNGFVDCYAAKSGERLWWVTGVDGNTVASPTLSDDVVLIGSSKANQNLAVSSDGRGDVTATAVKWRAADATSSFGSPLVAHGVAYFVNRSGVLYAVDPTSGATLWNERLPDSCWASPIAADGKIFLFTKGGATVVMQGGREQKRLAENLLTVEGRIYGVAAVNGAFIVRSGNRLWKLSETAKSP